MKPAMISKTRLRAPKFATLLVVLAVLLVVVPLVPQRFQIVVELLFDAVLVAGVFSAGAAVDHALPGGILTVATLTSRWLDLSQTGLGFSVLSTVLTLALIAYVVAIIVRSLFRQRDVTMNTIFGAIVAYLLSAIGFAVLYVLIVRFEPTSFAGIAAGESNAFLFREMIYFSLVSITTMGYGDIVPAIDVSRTISALEGVYGQVYLAVMIARLVGLHISADR